MSNRLASETSPYLLQHKDNPVDWYPWGDEAFSVASATDRPILLSVGYSTCHWCHVMERESFEDEETATLMNDLFVPVKVDREERPDVDAIYMDAVHAMTGRGGWPMTVFLTPTGEPFYAGTYFPDVDRHGVPSFRRVLAAIHDAWTHRRSEIGEHARELAAIVGRSLPPGEEAIDGTQLAAAYHTIRRQFDEVNGGLGGAPKFPQVPALEFLARAHAAPWAPEARTMLDTTLHHMAAGGIYDHLGGGFARYAVDGVWLVPHFEKMLYDNADLARLYLRGWQVTGNDRYRRVARETLEYIIRDLGHSDGGFHAAEDADSEGVEGKFYVFDHDEFSRVTGGDAAVAADHFGVTEAGNFEGTNVLHEAMPVERVAARHGLGADEVRAALERARAALFAHRSTRVRPGLDTKIIAAWNGLALRALAVAGATLDDERYLEAARRNARFVLSRMRMDDGRLFRTWSAGSATIPGFLDDHAAYALGLLELYQATGEVEWFEAGRSLIDLLEPHFGGPHGVVYSSAADASHLIVRPTDQQDNPSASGASLAAECFLALGLFTGESRYLDAHEQILKAGATLLERAPSAAGHLLAVASAGGRHREVALAGPEALTWARRLSSTYRPDVIVAPTTEPCDDIPLLAARYPQNGTLGYVCERLVCQAPVDSYEAVAELL